MRFIIIDIINIDKLVLAFTCLCSDMPMLIAGFCYILYLLYSRCWYVCAPVMKGDCHVHFG